MNALPSFEPPQHSPQRPKRRPRPQTAPTTPQSVATPPQSRVKSNPVYAHRRRGLEAMAKLVTYSSLSLFGLVTLINSIGYNLTQSGKLQTLETELQDTKTRTDKINQDFMRDFDPTQEKVVMQENTYKVAPDSLQILLVSPNKSAATK